MKIIERVKTGIDWIRRAVTQPQNQLTEMQTKARNGIEVLTYCARHLREDRAPVLAAAGSRPEELRRRRPTPSLGANVCS